MTKCTVCSSHTWYIVLYARGSVQHKTQATRTNEQTGLTSYYTFELKPSLRHLYIVIIVAALYVLPTVSLVAVILLGRRLDTQRFQFCNKLPRVFQQRGVGVFLIHMQLYCGLLRTQPQNKIRITHRLTCL